MKPSSCHFKDRTGFPGHVNTNSTDNNMPFFLEGRGEGGVKLCDCPESPWSCKSSRHVVIHSNCVIWCRLKEEMRFHCGCCDKATFYCKDLNPSGFPSGLDGAWTHIYIILTISCEKHGCILIGCFDSTRRYMWDFLQIISASFLLNYQSWPCYWLWCMCGKSTIVQNQ